MKKYYLSPEFRVDTIADEDVISMSFGDVDGDIIGWDFEDEGF